MSYSSSDINRIGKRLRENQSLVKGGFHTPFIAFLRDHSDSLTFFNHEIKEIVESEKGVIASRLKRGRAIAEKLKREGTMKLNQMQDVSGLRIIVGDIKSVDSVRKQISQLFEKKKESFSLDSCKDYIKQVKPDGYRSIHLIFKNEKGLRTEIQIRTKTQHSFATAVEILDWKHDLYKDGEESKAKLEKLSYISFMLNLYIEKKSKNKYHLNNIKHEWIDKVLKELKKIKPQELPLGEGHRQFLILALSEKRKGVILKEQFNTPDLAIKRYLELQEHHSGKNENIVLLRNTTAKAAQKNYPNYFAHTEEFIKLLEEIIKLSTQKRTNHN